MFRFVSIIFHSGYGNIFRFLLLYISISLLLINILLPLIPNFGFSKILNYEQVSQMIGIVSLAILGDLLYRSIKSSSEDKLLTKLTTSGIYDVFSELNEKKLEEVLSSSKNLIILNTWILNLERIAPILRRELKDEHVTIEFVILKASGRHAKERGIELNRDVEKAILANLDELNHFILNLKESEQKRIKIFEFDATPKFSIYGTTEHAIIGFFFPKLNLVDAPQIEIDRGKGYFSKRIWEYYETLEKCDITEKVLLK